MSRPTARSKAWLDGWHACRKQVHAELLQLADRGHTAEVRVATRDCAEHIRKLRPFHAGARAPKDP